MRANETLAREAFTPAHHVFYRKDGGYHDFNAVQEYRYYTLPLPSGRKGEKLRMREPAL